MNDSRASIVILGPQRLQPTVGAVLERVDVSGPVAVVTAGWQERECEDEELGHHLEGRGINLELYRRALDVFEKDPEFAEATHRRQRRLRDLQETYRLRLDKAVAAVRELRRFSGIDLEVLAWSCDSAMNAVRLLDAEHLNRQAEIHAEFNRRWPRAGRSSIEHHRRELSEILSGVECVLVAGGHVAVLINRLRLFGMAGMLEGRTVIAWSAGAMVLGERVVLFHDRPPQGRGNAEILEAGLGLYNGVIPFPQARRRLILDRPERVMLISRRFAPDRCIALDEGSSACLVHDSGWQFAGGAGELGVNGQVEVWR